MSATLPPPVPGTEVPAPPPGSGRTTPRVIAILTVALGSALVVGTVATAVVPTVAAARTTTEERSLDVAGVTTLDVDVAAMSLDVVFANVDEANLDVRDSTGGSWTFELDGSTLRVETPRTPFMSWFGGGNGRGTLTLPIALAGVDADFALGAGDLLAEGDFGRLGVDLGAGDAAVTGSAEDLSVEVSAGRADLDVDDVTTADLQVSAGTLIARLTGTAPDEVRGAVSAGSLELTLPDEEYDVSSEVSAGSFDNGLRTSPAAPRQVRIEVAAGDARAVPGD